MFQLCLNKNLTNNILFLKPGNHPLLILCIRIIIENVLSKFCLKPLICFPLIPHPTSDPLYHFSATLTHSSQDDPPIRSKPHALGEVLNTLSSLFSFCVSFSFSLFIPLFFLPHKQTRGCIISGKCHPPFLQVWS